MDVPTPSDPTDEEIDGMAIAVAERDGITVAAARKQVLALLAERAAAEAEG